MPISPLQQFLSVFEYELKQAFYSRKALIAFTIICSFFFILLYWLFQLESALLNRESIAEARIAEKFKEIVLESFYESFPFLSDCPFYITILQFYFLVCIPALSFVLIADIASHELRDRTFRYFAFRINLITVILGKYAAYIFQFTILSAIMWAVAIISFESLSESPFEAEKLVYALRYSFHFWFIDNAIWACSIAISLLISIVFKNPYIGMAIVNVFIVFLIASKYTKDLMQDIFLGYLYPVSPELTFSVSSFLIAAVFFLSCSILVMKRREL